MPDGTFIPQLIFLVVVLGATIGVPGEGAAMVAATSVGALGGVVVQLARKKTLTPRQRLADFAVSAMFGFAVSVVGPRTCASCIHWWYDIPPEKVTMLPVEDTIGYVVIFSFVAGLFSSFVFHKFVMEKLYGDE